MSFEFKNVLEYIRTMLYGNTWLLAETTGSALFIIWKFELKTSKTESRLTHREFHAFLIPNDVFLIVPHDK